MKKFDSDYYGRLWWGTDISAEDFAKEVWKDGFNAGAESRAYFFAGAEVLLKEEELCYGVVVSDEDDDWVRVLCSDGSVPAYSKDEAHRYLEKTGNAYSEVMVLREKLFYSQGREF